MFCRVLNPSLPEVWKQASGRPLGEIAQENKGTLTVWAFSDGRVSAFPSFCLVLFSPPNQHPQKISSQQVCSSQHRFIIRSSFEWQSKVSQQYLMYFVSGACGSARLLINIASCPNLGPFSPSRLSSCPAFFLSLLAPSDPFPLLPDRKILPAPQLGGRRFSHHALLLLLWVLWSFHGGFQFGDYASCPKSIWCRLMRCKNLTRTGVEGINRERWLRLVLHLDARLEGSRLVSSFIIFLLSLLRRKEFKEMLMYLWMCVDQWYFPFGAWFRVNFYWE